MFRFFLGALVATLIGGSASAATEINVLYGLPWLFKETHETIAREFMAENPGIKVNLLAPAKSYEEVVTAVLRGAVAGSVPDVAFCGTNLMGVVVDRALAQPLDQFISDEKDWAKQGYIPGMLATSQVDGKQYGMPFALSTPIAYYNIDIVKRAGGDPDNLPKTWDDVLALSEKINKLGGDTKSMFIHWQTTGNYLWQALLFTNGGKLLTEDKKKAAFNSPEGMRALTALHDFSARAKMPNYTREQGRQDFTAGMLGMQFSSSAELTLVTKQIGSKFELRTAPFPTPRLDTKIVSGGATAMLFAKDKDKQKAAWAYMKYLSGARAQTTMARLTGYIPSNQIAIDTPAMLGDYYAKAPNARTSLQQLPRATAWVGFPGDNSVKIIDVITDNLESVVALRAAPKDAMVRMEAEVNALLPK
ncbi:ABC transporter substrate-binding protein [Bradyrhizobium sediminis]|uniref:ABC transporter substrate-binding protein n=1 Tax=Bradyrhizobium sediminis TaxID=2840469 RepID=A0A975NNV5_9BRAD|nr:ABC transporter substrate-binding protein [Bradyrhizobium sediminis]QWG18290.1 ABC transporter substrate-binding protein [Bradyrhizobium sediminis]